MPCLRNLLDNSEVPVVLDGFIADWHASNWSPANLVNGLLSSTNLMWRIGSRHSRDVQWEGDCQYVKATLSQFNEYISTSSYDRNIPPNKNPLLENAPPDTAWVYADYKHLPHIVSEENYQKLVNCVDWSRFGYHGRDGSKSTLWIGTDGAYTPCHYDTYGYNLVAQIYGRKRWVLFPPSRLEDLKPIRIPLEESSVFSQLNLSDPHQLERLGDRFEIVLKPGQVLFVPKHWWHFVENLETSISINTWVELDSDGLDRESECLATILTSTLIRQSGEPPELYLNPKQELSGLTQGLQLLNEVFLTQKTSDGKKAVVANSTIPCPCLHCKSCSMDNSQQTITRLKVYDRSEFMASSSVTGVKRKITDSSSDRIDLKRLINAVCHPRVLDEIRTILCKDLQL